MFILTLKKSFFDAWDNLGIIIMANLSLLFITVPGLIPVFKLMERHRAAGWFSLASVLVAAVIALGTVSSLMSELADYRRVSWRDIPAAAGRTWLASLGFVFTAGGYIMINSLGISYYSMFNNLFGVAAKALLIWISFGIYLASLWFFAVRNRLSGGFFKSLKKCVLLMIDNTGFSLFSGLVIIPLQLLLWPLTAFAAFGPAGIQLYYNTALRLLMYKYDWLEEHPQAKKRDIPWDELLVDEKERVGTRTLKGMIFPWKE
ncbi:MAG: hypothetical protein B0D92_06025 [Spirochaeta sp. LUC14_002_19_P3]|nr:MAG: hypothetical protein B0D92_06025 [Spirochaeta sp. LUC14_002_19_P3]